MPATANNFSQAALARGNHRRQARFSTPAPGPRFKLEAMKSDVSTLATDAPPSTAWRACQGVPAGAIDENELIERYLPLVRNVVDRIKLTLPSHIEAADLHSVGITGLIAAVRRFDPEQGSTFASYAATRIRGAILDELRRMDWCPRRARARARKLKEAINGLEQRLGRAALEKEICEELDLGPREYAKWLEDSRPVTFIAIDQAADGEDSGGASLHELLADQSDETGREKMEKKELLQLMTQRIAGLPDIPRKILAMYYFENMRLAEIAQVFDLTESRICQIHSQTILGLRAFINRAQNR
jgi:RNA polymerase sigma factor for flagellar operon FliA